MSWQKTKLWQRSMAWLAVAALMVQPQLLFAVETAPQPVRQRMEVPRDVVLAEGGMLIGQLLNEQKVPMSQVVVSLQTADKEVARTTTDHEGKFQVKNLRGGVYTVVAKGHQGVYRQVGMQQGVGAFVSQVHRQFGMVIGVDASLAIALDIQGTTVGYTRIELLEQFAMRLLIVQQINVDVLPRLRNGQGPLELEFKS